MREYGCPTGKIQYDRPQAAYRDLSGIVRTRNGRADGDIYRCPHCGKWHMTHAHKPKPRGDDDVDHSKKARQRWRLDAERAWQAARLIELTEGDVT